MKEQIFRGVAPAIVTPFNNDESVNFDKLTELVERQIKGKADAIIACGTTGESVTLTDDEQLAVIGHVIRTVNGRIPVIAGTGSNNTRHAIHMTREAEKLGADGILSVTPYYNRPSQRGCVQHFSAIAECTDLPIILYNVPSRTGTNLNPETIAEIARKNENVVAVKECVTDQTAKILQLAPKGFATYSGNDDEVEAACAAGGSGLISTASNAIPEYMHDLTHAFLNGEIQKGRELQEGIMPLINGLFQPGDGNPGTTKALLNAMGLNVGSCRLPVVEPIGENLEKLLSAARKTRILQ